MPRHYSKVLIELPDCAGDPQEIVISIDCDVCGLSEFRTHVVHFGTVVRVLADTFHSLGGDSGTAEFVTGFVPGTDKARVLDYLNKVFTDWKYKRIRGQH